MRMLVTGASGFVGRTLCRHLLRRGIAVRAATRSETGRARLATFVTPDELEIVRIDDMTRREAWEAACRDCAAVIHLAGCAERQAKDAASEAATFYRRANVDPAQALAEAAAAGVPRFVLASSALVYGSASPPGMPFDEHSPLAPDDDYARSKQAAEQVVEAVAQKTGLACALVRIPPVYGAGAQGGIRTLRRLAATGLPLPFSGFGAKRSFVGVDNLADFLCVAATHPAAANRVLLVSDGADLTLAQWLQALARAEAKKTRLFYVPPALLRLAATLIGQQQRYTRLTATFQIDPTASCAALAWQPPFSLAEGLRRWHEETADRGQ